jgi:ABC-type sugar transport system permease subunit
MDGAGRVAGFFSITLPLLRPTLVVVLLFRLLDALRVFDLIYALTGGGPGTATEPLQLLTFSTLLEHLKFGAGSALGVLLFLLSGTVAAIVLVVGNGKQREAT